MRLSTTISSQEQAEKVVVGLPPHSQEVNVRWNYRIVIDNDMFSIRGVYYDETGHVMGFDEGDSSPAAASIEELRNTLEAMLDSLTKPPIHRSEPGESRESL
jgi:hypothetical protein